jgi:DNA-binding NtrC family response regulator
MIFPKILVIDDQFGKYLNDRRNLCLNFNLRDITGDDPTPEEVKDPVAEAKFSSAQRVENGFVLNDSAIAISAIREGWPGRDRMFWTLMLLDIRFVSGRITDRNEPEGQPGDMDFGLILLEEIRRRYSDLPVVMLSSRERGEVIEECRNKGAADFIQRIGYLSETKSGRDVLAGKLFQHGLLPDLRELKDEKKRIFGDSLPMLLTLRSARRAATGKRNILILGETGTGKELLAEYIHDMSPKSNGRFVVYHPGRAETLQEDELFGHVKGAFTGASSDREGVFERATGGTLFIDEIGDISEGVQLKLLRPLENRVVSRQGGDREIPLDIQVVLSTNKNLEEYAKTGEFKSDLLNRINAYPITIPPLRDHRTDIPLIAEHLLEYLCKEHDARWPRRILPEATERLKGHEWPDNVRGLRNVLERAVLDSKDSELVVPSDIRFDTILPDLQQGQAFSTREMGEVIDSIDELIKRLSAFKFPKDYGRISGKLPALQESIAMMMANYLLSAIEVTKKMKPGNSSDGEINLTGAVSCMMGEQLKTPKASDVIKKLLQQDRASLERLLRNSPILNKVYSEALRLRPKKPKK